MSLCSPAWISIITASGICAAAVATKFLRRRHQINLRLAAGKHVVLTGASSGIGCEAAKLLLAGGATLTIVGREEARTRSAVHSTSSSSSSSSSPPSAPKCPFSAPPPPSPSSSSSCPSFTFIHSDFTSLQSVRQCAQQLKDLNRPIDVLILNAGVYNRELFTTVDGFEQTFQVNYLASFLLVQHLWDLLVASRTRIVVVSSELHRQVADLSIEDLLAIEGSFNGHRRYAETKLLNVLFTNELALRLEGTGATALSVRPGFIPTTQLFRAEFTRRPWLHLLSPFLCLFFRSPIDGAHALLVAAFNTSLPSGSYVSVNGVEKGVKDPPLSKQLWDWTVKLL